MCCHLIGEAPAAAGVRQVQCTRTVLLGARDRGALPVFQERAPHCLGCTDLGVCVRMCVYMCVRACVCVCVRVCVCVCVRGMNSKCVNGVSLCGLACLQTEESTNGVFTSFPFASREAMAPSRHILV